MKTPRTDAALRHGGPSQVLERLERVAALSRELEETTGALVDRNAHLVTVIDALHKATMPGAQPRELAAARHLAGETLAQFSAQAIAAARMAAVFKPPFEG